MAGKSPDRVPSAHCNVRDAKDNSTIEGRQSTGESELEKRVLELETEFKSAMKTLKCLKIRLSDLEATNRPRRLVDGVPMDNESAAVAVGGSVMPHFQPILKKDMEAEIKTTIDKQLHYLIGVAKWVGDALQSAKKYEENIPELGKGQTIDYKVNLITVFYTKNKLHSEKGYAADTEALRDKYRENEFCLNAKSGEDEFFSDKTAKEGIAFLRVFCK